MSWVGQAAQHESDHGEARECGDGAGVSLEVARQAAIAADPSQGALDDPALGQDDKFSPFMALDDFDRPIPRTGCGLCHARSLIAGIGKDAHDEGEEAAASLIEDPSRAVAILDIGGMNGDVQEKAERVDEDMPLAARDLLRRIIALRIDRGPPFCAPLALWLSMIAALGLASRPSRSRVAT